VISAIHHATGIWFKEQPVTPEKIVMAIKEKKKHGGTKSSKEAKKGGDPYPSQNSGSFTP
jgi:hypothetical protein